MKFVEDGKLAPGLCGGQLRTNSSSSSSLSAGTEAEQPYLDFRAGCDSLVSEDPQPMEQHCFSAAMQPFLFPLNLLDHEIDETSSSVQENHDEIHATPMTEVDRQQSSFWLLHTKPRQEKKLAEELRKLSISHYLPVAKCKAVTRGRTRITLSPQFPSYLFLFATDDQRRRVLQTNRVVANHPVVQNEALRLQLWDLADLIEKEVPLTVEARLAPGTWVRVKSGILKDKEGTVIKRAGKTRLFVFVNELLGGVSVEVEEHLLEPYGTPPNMPKKSSTVTY